jgi:ferredoxin-NADP reductase
LIINKPYILSGIKKTTPEVTTFTFKSQDGSSMDFIPGMFAMLYHKDPSTGESIGRAFSIANPPPSDSLQFFISMIHGKFTSKLDAAKIGDIYYVSGPYGQFKFDFSAQTKFLFLAGGTGLAPFFSMLESIRGKGKSADGVLIYSTKYANDIIEKDQLEKISQDTGFKLTVTVTRSQDGDGWTGEKGHVDASMILKYAPDCKERISYICGPPGFVKAVKEALISLGVNEKMIKAEMWG